MRGVLSIARAGVRRCGRFELDRDTAGKRCAGLSRVRRAQHLQRGGLSEKSESPFSRGCKPLTRAPLTPPGPPPEDPRRPNVPAADRQLPAVRDYEQVDREIVGTLRPTVKWAIGLGVAVFF